MQNFQTHNTVEQNSHILQNFDLKEYRQVLNDVAVHIYQELLKTIQDKLNSLISMSLFILSLSYCFTFILKTMESHKALFYLLLVISLHCITAYCTFDFCLEDDFYFLAVV